MTTVFLDVGTGRQKMLPNHFCTCATRETPTTVPLVFCSAHTNFSTRPSSSQNLMHCTLSFTVSAHLANEQASSAKQILFRGVMTPTLLLVRPGLHSTDVGLL